MVSERPKVSEMRRLMKPKGRSNRSLKHQKPNGNNKSTRLRGKPQAILAIATATSEGIKKVAEAIQDPGGYEAVQLRVAEQYIGEFGELAKASNTLVLPASVSDVGSMIALAMNVINKSPGKTPTDSVISGSLKVDCFNKLWR